jgi:PadR family transcriptional regulator, regulatory protein PadR
VSEPLPVVRGTVDLLVLKALSLTPMHGFEVTAWLEARSGQGLSFDDSAIYQALYRMEKKRWVKASWGITENNRKARYYQVTAAGRAHLASETSRLLRYSETIAQILTSVASA